MPEKPIKPFRLQYEEYKPKPPKPKQPVVRLKPSYYQLLELLKRETGLPLGRIVEQCIDYAIENMEKGGDAHERKGEEAGF